MKKLRINVCMLTYSFYESDGRVKRYAESLARQGANVDVISIKKPGQSSYHCIKGVNVYRIQDRLKNEKNKFAYLERLLRFLGKSFVFLSKRHFRNPYQIIHIHSIPDFEVYAALVPKLNGAKLILDIHDIVPELYLSKFSRDTEGALFKTLLSIEKLSIAFVDHVIISNHLWEETLLSRSVDSHKCTTFMNYPDPNIFNNRKRSRNDDKFIIMYPGTLNWHQGLDLAVEAFGKIAGQIPKAEFHIYGEGNQLGRLHEMIHTNQLHDRVFIGEPLPIESIANIMANADLGVIPKRDDPFGGQAFSTKSLEFMTLGVPLVIAKTQIDNYYFNNSVVKFFEPENVDAMADAILEMYKNNKLRNELSKNARQFAQNFSWEIKEQKYLNLIDSLVHN